MTDKKRIPREQMSERDRLRQHLVVQGLSSEQIEIELDRIEKRDLKSETPS